LVKFANERPYADPEVAMRKILVIASTVEPVQDGRIHIEKINGPFLYEHGGLPGQYGAGLRLAIERGQQGRQFVPNNMGQTAGMMNQNTTTGYTVTFKCLLPNDPAIAKYQLQPAPNVIIEQRNR
jgi:hypothetical protein